MEEIKNIIECSICLETFTDPRILPCIHTFCLQCLEKTVLKMEEQQPKDKLLCPICRMETSIPPQGVDGFQKNFFMLRLKEIMMTAEPLGKLCDICLESMDCDENETPIADVYCMQCHKNICRRCSRSHKSIVELKGHQLIKLGTEITENIFGTYSHQDCPRHNNEQAKMYCSDCKEVICIVCFAENHQNHKCSGVEKVGGTFRQELKDVESKIDRCMEEWMKTIQESINEKTNLQKDVENIKQKVAKRKDELEALIDKYELSLSKKLTAMQQSKLQKIKNEMDENERQLAVNDSFKTYCKQIEAKGTDVELCQVVPSLKRRVEEMQETCRSIRRRRTELTHLEFEQTNLKELLKSKNAIGRIKDTPVRSSGKMNIPSSSFVFGVTKLKNKIYILCTNPNVVRIFHDKDSFDLEKEIDLANIEEPRDIASSEVSNCLYVEELLNKCVWKITTEDHSVTKWLTTDGQCAMSVTSEGHVLLITFDSPHKLEVYSSDAALIRRCSLPSDICEPLHIICKPSGEFVISHRKRTHRGMWSICRVDSDGKTVIARFDPKTNAEKLNKPCHLALDSDNDELFVADRENNRVILLDPISLTLRKVLLTTKKDGINAPFGLFYDGIKKQLIVVHSSNKVFVYVLTHRN